jgi:hypothetical protein
VPLHTPDILAAAHLVRAYTLGYALTGEADLLEKARHWAWTGVPFVYLAEPAPGQPIGLYATIAVLGATNWTAPVWIGLPVQWCGLVYADALYRLVRHDPRGPWKRLADGITASGLQQTWPRAGSAGGDRARQGLLPDSFTLDGQVRNDVAINPGTLQANAIRLLDGSDLYDLHVFRGRPDGKGGGNESGGARLFVHAPGAITGATEEPAAGGRDGGHLRIVAFTVRGWRPSGSTYHVLLAGLPRRAGSPPPRLRINGKDAASDSPPHEYRPDEGWLIVGVPGGKPARIEVRL